MAYVCAVMFASHFAQHKLQEKKKSSAKPITSQHKAENIPITNSIVQTSCIHTHLRVTFNNNPTQLLHFCYLQGPQYGRSFSNQGITGMNQFCPSLQHMSHFIPSNNSNLGRILKNRCIDIKFNNTRGWQNWLYGARRIDSKNIQRLMWVILFQMKQFK